MSFSFSTAFDTLSSFGANLLHRLAERHHHHSARAMSSHPPNDSASAFGLRHHFIIRRVRCSHIPPMIRHPPSAFGTISSFGACDVLTSPQ
ncbi:hypothetical protein ACE6H2_010163 [Prunus campanulata]